MSDGPPGWLGRLSEGQMVIGLVLFGLLLYLPFAGSYGLWDPWETHYGEVARQMVKRGDYISLWWPGSPREQETFWSKPVLTFWIMSFGMQVARVGLPGGAADEMAVGHRAEWALRMPMVVAAILALLAVYWVVARFVSRRAGVLAAVVLATSPMFSLIARQAMTDMVFLAPMTLALCLGALALLDDRDELLPRRGKGWRSFPHHVSFYLTLAVFLIIMVPQLVVNSVQLKIWVPWKGSRVLMYGAVAMIPYYLGSIAFIWLAARARYRAPLYLYLAGMCCGLAVLAKGLAGLGLPVIIFLAYLFFTWNWSRLRRAQLLPAIAVATLVCALVAVPWHHAMIMRHGWAFWTELFGDNHWRRLVLGRHGDRGSFEYFLRELGYGLLPWVALAPAALAALVAGRRGKTARPEDKQRRAVYWLGAIWAASAYAVVSVSMTKFHHYILPALPGIAIVLGCFLDDLMKTYEPRRGALLALVGVPLLGVVVHDLVKTKNAAELFLWLFSYDYVHSKTGRPWPEALDFRVPLLVFAGLFALALVALAWRRGRRLAVPGLGLLAVAFTYFLLDVYMRGVAPYWSQKEPIAAYYKARRSPDEKLVAYMMFWRGETFYTKNAIYEGVREERTVFDTENADDGLKSWIDRHRGRRVFFIFERARQGRLVSLLPEDARPSFTVIHDKNNKFSVAHADI